MNLYDLWKSIYETHRQLKIETQQDTNGMVDMLKRIDVKVSTDPIQQYADNAPADEEYIDGVATVGDEDGDEAIDESNMLAIDGFIVNITDAGISVILQARAKS